MPDIPQPILDALKNNRLILWVGAGFSQHRLGLPSWRGLVDELADACLPAAEATVVKANLDSEIISEVQALESLISYQNTCTAILKKRFGILFNQDDERLTDFFDLWQISQKIITTNYDLGLDSTKPTHIPKILPSNKWHLQDLIEYPHFYFKLHGCASEPDSCILFQDQYTEIYRTSHTAISTDKETPAKFHLKRLLAENTVLFIGFGMERSVHNVLDYLDKLLDGTEPPKFLLTKKDDNRKWDHTKKWMVDDWADIPKVISALVEVNLRFKPIGEPQQDLRISFEREYVGRDDAIEKLESFFNSDKRFFFLYGAGGMGKSHLLDAVIKRLEPKRRPLYFKLTADTRLRDLARAVGLPYLPPSRSDRPHAYFLKALEKLNRTIVFDDFYECKEEILQQTLMALPHQPEIRSMLISRSLPQEFSAFDSGIRTLEIQELDHAAYDACLRDLNEESEYFPGGLSDDIINQCWDWAKGYPLGGQLLLGLFAEPDFDIHKIQTLNLENDPDRKIFVRRLLAVILKEGREVERDLAHQIAVFDEAVPESAFHELPAWRDDHVPFQALWKRKRILAKHFEERTAFYGMHALIRSLLLEKYGDPPQARQVAGRFYEANAATVEKAKKTPLLQKAFDHFERSAEEDRRAFEDRMKPLFVDLNVVQLRDKWNPIQQIKDLQFRLRFAPEDISAQNELGMAYRADGNLIKAIEVLQKASDAGHVPSMNELGITLREAGQRDKAIEVLQKAADAGNIQSFNELGITLREAGQRDKAIEVLQKAADAGHVPSMNELGITLREAGQCDKAIEVLQKAADTGNIYAMNELGITLREAKQRDKAIEVLQKAADAGHGHSMNELGITLREVGQRDKAIEVLQKAAELQPNNVILLNELGITLREEGQRDKAIEVLQKAVELQPNNVILLNGLGITLREAGQCDKAIEVLQKAADAGHVHSMNELGITLRKAGQLDKAIEVLQKAAELQPNNVILLNELGITLREAEQLDKAIEVLLKAVELQPDNYILRNKLAIALREVGKKAIIVLQKAADAGNIYAMNQLGITLREAGQCDKAIEVLQKAADAGNIYAMNQLGITLREAGQPDKAIEVLQKAADAGNIHAMNELGITLREAGQLDKAIDVLQKALKKKPNNTFLKRTLLQIYLFFHPNMSMATPLLAESDAYLKGSALKIYTQVGEHLDTLLRNEASELADYRQYISQLFYYKSWHFAVKYLSGLVQKYPRGEFIAKLGEALCQPIIGRSQEGIPLLREAVEELEQKPLLRSHFQETAVVLLEIMSHKGKKEFKKTYERWERDLLGYVPFEEKRAEWEEKIKE